MTKQKIVWHKLPYKYNLFTRRNTMMVNLANNKIVQHYSSNVKIVLVEQALHNGVRYFRTTSAAERGLDWAFKADSFILPKDDAPLEPLDSPTLNSNLRPKAARSASAKQKSVQNAGTSKNGEKSQKSHNKKGGVFKGLLKLFGR